MTRIYCDGATDHCCYVVEGSDPVVADFPKTTQNQGEYQIVILALEEAKRLKLEQITLYTDSLLVANQVNGIWRCRAEHLLPFRDRVRELAQELQATISWIGRDQNIAGKVLG